HLALVHSAANRWVYDSGLLDEESGDRIFAPDSLSGWEAVAGHGWRTLASFPQPAETIAIGDALTFWFALHGHRHARESIGQSWEIAAGTPIDNQGVHTALQRLPATFLDGHGTPQPLSQAYWQDTVHTYSPPGNAAVPLELFDREVQRLIWYIARK